MEFKFDQITSGMKTIKAYGGLHKVTFSVCLYDNVLQANMHLNSMPGLKVEDVRTLTGECPAEMADEMLYWLVVDIASAIAELSEESA